MAKRLNPILRFSRALLPIAVGVVVVVGAFEGWLVYRVTHPRRTNFEITPSHYQLFTGEGVSWSEEQWDNTDGTTASGWLLRGATGAPAIVVNHGYSKNRAELLNLGVKLCEIGYNVLLPDLRGHGASAVSYTSLGIYEKDDLNAAVNFLKGKKNPQGQALVDGNRIGVYGVSLGGYAALTAAAENPTIKVVIADSAYPKPNWLTQSVLKEMFSSDPPFLNMFADWGLRGYFWGHYNEGSAEDALTRYKGQKLWMVTTQTNMPIVMDLNQTTLDLFQQAQFPKEIVKVERSRAEARDAYDDRIVSIFRKDLPR
ncbi:MAG: alpha/beta fold hydrolase [Acidobacteria bacterium]|nr:alpha/beta fold hydrolase [Acidobacteriota bacterium]